MDKQAELDFKRDWTSTLINLAKEVMPTEYADMCLEIIQKTYDRHDLRGMRMIFDDLNEDVSGESSETKRRWNKVLKEKFGMDLCDINKKMAERMAKVLKRGKIRNDDEFVRVTEWVDHLIQDGPKIDDNPDGELSEEIQAYNKLISDYEAKAAAKLARQRKRNEQTT